MEKGVVHLLPQFARPMVRVRAKSQKGLTFCWPTRLSCLRLPRALILLWPESNDVKSILRR